MDGLLLVRKPSGPTSHDCVVRLRRILGTKRVGHFGTLDPFAEGLLLVGLGKATRLFPFIGSSDKTYEGRIRLGQATDTYDLTGTPQGPEAAAFPCEAEVQAAMSRFRGEIDQAAPPFSAKKLAGKPLYAYARNGIEMERRISRVRIDRFDLRAYRPPDIDFEAACSAGTYLRSLAHDLGTVLGCGAHLTSLTRTSCGPYRLESARTFEEIEAAAAAGRLEEIVFPMESLLGHLPAAVLTAAGRKNIKNGRSVPLSDPEQVFFTGGLPPEGAILRLFDDEQHLIALARVREGRGAPFLVLI